MTSLNPLHTIEQQIGEILLLHAGLADAPARKRIVRAADRGRHSGAAVAARQLSAPALRRPAPARHDRHGARQRARPADRRRAHHRARRHRAGANPQAPEGPAGPARHGHAVHHPRPRHRAQARRAGLRDEGGQDRRARPDRAGVQGARASLYARAASRREPRPDPAPVRPDAPVVLETDDLKVWFPIKRGFLRRVVGHIKAVDGVSIAVRQGETLGIVGESGSGKTTLGLAILRLISSQGRIVFLGQADRGPEIPRHAAVPPRHADRVPGPLWVAQPAHVGIRHHRGGAAGAFPEAQPAPSATQRVVRALADVGLDTDSRFRYPHEFSGGQRQRIALARAIVLEPTFVVLDEPTSALDMLIQSQMVDLLRALQKRLNLTYLFISHDLRVVAALASRLVVMRNGKVVEEGPAADLFAHPQSATTRAPCSPPPSISRPRPRASSPNRTSAVAATLPAHGRARSTDVPVECLALGARAPGQGLSHLSTLPLHAAGRRPRARARTATISSVSGGSSRCCRSISSATRWS